MTLSLNIFTLVIFSSLITRMTVLVTTFRQTCTEVLPDWDDCRISPIVTTSAGTHIESTRVARLVHTSCRWSDSFLFVGAWWKELSC